MAHHQQRQFFERLKAKMPQYFQGTTVIEIGSLDINGTIRDLFENPKEYVGVDVAAGKGVDIVAQGQYYAHGSEVDVAVSAECFEHNPFWVETVLNMYLHVRDGGLLAFTCATDGRPEHGTTRTTPNDSPLTVGLGWDYYRNLNEQDFTSAFNFDKMFSEWAFEVNRSSQDLYFYGVVKGVSIDS
jgi:hypothetical protein